MKKIVWLAIFCMVLALFSQFIIRTPERVYGSVNDFFVNPSSGSDSNDGSSAHPWKTIQHADSALTLGANGTNVHVLACPGSSPCISGFVPIAHNGTASQIITWISDTKWGAKIDGVVEFYCAWCNLFNFDVQDTATSDDGITTSLNNTVTIYGHDQIIRGNHVHNVKFTTTPNGQCPGGEGNSGINIAAESPNVWVDANFVNQNGHWGGCTSSGGSSAHGIYMSGWGDIATNNIVMNSAGWGISMYHNPCQNVAANNSLIHNYTGGIQVAGAPGSGHSSGSVGTDGFQCGTDDYTSINNNIFIANGFGTPAPGAGHSSGGLYLGNSGVGPHIKAFHNFFAANQVAGSGSATITITSGAISNGTNPQTNIDGGTSTAGIFKNYQADGSGDYTPIAAQLINGGITDSSTVCAIAPGRTSGCIPTTDFNLNTRSGIPWIGAIDAGGGPPPPGNYLPTSYDFGSQNTGFTARVDLVLTNAGASPEVVSTISFTGTNAGLFSETSTNSCGNTPFTVGVGATCTIHVGFTPVTTGSFTANLSVADNSATTPHLTVLTGTGQTPSAPSAPTGLVVSPH